MHPEILQIAREKIGQYLRETREEKNLTLYAVGKKSGLSIPQIRQIETGQTNYTVDSFLSICHALDCYFYLAPKDGKHLDFADMAEKSL